MINKKIIYIAGILLTFGVIMVQGDAHVIEGNSSSIDIKKLYTGYGVIKRIDVSRNRVLMEHDEIEELEMPAMIMAFTLENADVAKGFGENDKIKFEFTHAGKVNTIKWMKAHTPK